MNLILIFALLIIQVDPQMNNQTKTNQPEKEIDTITQKKIVDIQWPTPKSPKITLKKALTIAEHYIEREKIDVSSFYLREARLIFPTESAESQQWYFWWASIKGEMGNYIEITVSMKGEVKRNPSM